MKATVLLIILFSLSAAIPAADIYQWIDRDGNLHMVDDYRLVPEGFRKTVRGGDTGAGLVWVDGRKPLPRKGRQPLSGKKDGREMYGEYSLKGWRDEIESKRGEIKELESRIRDYERYISVWEKGRLFGQAFSQEEVSIYEKYKKYLPSLKGELKAVEQKLDILMRRANVAGVPRNIRERK